MLHSLVCLLITTLIYFHYVYAHHNHGLHNLKSLVSNYTISDKICVIFPNQMTANALSESAEECYENGMDSFVSKPVTFQKLKQCLEQYLSP